MSSRIIGSILLIVAMSIGGGLISLPIVTAAPGFFHSTLMLILVWLIMTLGALFILEVCLWLPQDTNLVSMAKDTLGIPGQAIAWSCYLIMLYCIMCVYISGGTDLVQSIWQSVNLKIYHWISTLVFVGVLGSIVWHGIKLIDHTNRMLMTVKMTVYIILVLMLLPLIHNQNLPTGSWKLLPSAVMPAIFSFGYAIIIPSLRSYLHSNHKQLRLVVLIGSAIPLICFIIWNYAVQGTMSQAFLMAINQSGDVVSQLNIGLSAIGNPWITTVIHIFTTVCLLTAFLAVSLSLSDFIADGFNWKRKGTQKWLIYACTFIPPLLIVVFKPYIFITAIRYAGVLIVIILILLPALMAWKGRKNKNFTEKTSYKVPGGIATILFLVIISIILLSIAITHLA